MIFQRSLDPKWRKFEFIIYLNNDDVAYPGLSGLAISEQRFH